MQSWLGLLYDMPFHHHLHLHHATSNHIIVIRNTNNEDRCLVFSTLKNYPDALTKHYTPQPVHTDASQTCSKAKQTQTQSAITIIHTAPCSCTCVSRNERRKKTQRRCPTKEGELAVSVVKSCHADVVRDKKREGRNNPRGSKRECRERDAGG